MIAVYTKSVWIDCGVSEVSFVDI